MLEILVHANPIRQEAVKAPIPTPADDEVLIKVIATDSNPKDWKHARFHKNPLNQGDDISGVVAAVGKNVIEFHVGDRVAAFHKMGTPHGSYAEYSIASASTTFHLPPNTSFEEGATLPLASMTAALALFEHLGLPLPWHPVPKGQTLPVLIYGGASTVGAFALKLAKLSNLNPIITVASSKSLDFVNSMKAADYVIDYRKGNVVDALGENKLLHAFDAICANGSWNHILEVLSTNGGHINLVDPPTEGLPNLPAGVKSSRTYVASAYGEKHSRITEEEATQHADFAFVFYRYISRLLQEGKFSGHPFEIMPNGLLDVAKGIRTLETSQVSAKKVVYRYKDIPVHSGIDQKTDNNFELVSWTRLI